MSLSLDAKRDIITKNKDPAIAAIRCVIDSYYNVIDAFTNEKQELKTDQFKTETALNIAMEIKNDITTFEKILRNLIDEKELSKAEVAYIGVAFAFCSEKADNQIKLLTKAKEGYDEIWNSLLDPEEKVPKIISSKIQKN